MKNIIWTARYQKAPEAVRYCKHCGSKTVFSSSGLFRVNARQKVLDVWLIYKCTGCETTWNMTVLSRVKTSSLPPALLHGFYTNDQKLAMRYATDSALVRRCGAEPAVPEIEIVGEPVSLSEPARILLRAEWPSEMKASAALRQKLGLSKSAFHTLCETGGIVCVSGHNLQKCRLSGDIVIELRQPDNR